MATAPALLPTLHLLGSPELRSGGGRLRLVAERRCQLLVLLGASAGQWVTRDSLAALLWPEHPPAAARRNLRKVVFDARALPGTQDLQTTTDALRWPVTCDLHDFNTALRERRHADAVALGGPALLTGIDDPANAAFSDWLAQQRTRFAEAWQHAAHEQLRQSPALSVEAQLALARQLLLHDPLDDGAVAVVMQVALARGESGVARRAYQTYRQRLAEELGIEPSNALRQLWQRAGTDSTLAAVPTSSPTTAPPATVFVGRGSELAEIDALMSRADCRLLTLLGPGGVGKSRLARQVLVRSAQRFPGGSLWLELQDLDGSAAVTTRLAQQLGLQPDDHADTLTQVAAALHGERTLLALDNAEHLAELPAWADRLLAAAPTLTLLVTSRERLHCAGEWLRPLAGLDAPDEDSRDLDAARHFDAVRLFELRACAARPDFDLAPQLAAVLDIVDAVGGLPLAIELAASWVRLLPATEIARDLRQSMALLQRDPGRAPPAARPEHASLAAMLEGSWARLSAHERTALTAVSVFEGGFKRAAAQAVAGIGLPLLAALVDRSLLQVDATGRFGMHPLAASWARDKRVAQPGPSQDWQRAHAVHFAAWLQALAPLRRKAPRLLVEQLHAEQANWTAAWRHALHANPQPGWDLLKDMLPALQAYFETQGRWSEGLALLRPALALAGDSAPARLAKAHLQAALAALLYRRGDLHEAEASAWAAIEGARAADGRMAEIAGLNTLGLTLWNQGRSLEALPHLNHLLVLARAEGDASVTGRALNTLALAEKALGRYASSLQRQQEVLALQRALGDRVGLTTALNNIGNLHRALKQYRQALPCFEEALQLCAAEGLVSQRSFASLNLGLTLCELGEWTRAETICTQTLAQVRQAGQAQIEVSTLMALARCAVHGQHFEAALASMREALALARAKGFDAHVPDILGIYAECCSARGQQGRAASLWCWLVRQPQPDELVRAEARERLSLLALDTTALAAAQTVADGLNIETACAWLVQD